MHSHSTNLLPSSTVIQSILRIRFSSPVYPGYREEAWDHEASNQELIEEDTDEHNVEKVEFSTKHHQFQ